MIDTSMTTERLCRTISLVADGDKPVIVRYGSMDAKVPMHVQMVEIDEKTGQVVIVVDA